MSLDDMAVAHRDDYHALYAMRDLRAKIEIDLKDLGTRCSPSTRQKLREAVDGLRADENHIVAVWD